MSDEKFQKTPRKANLWFRAFIVLSLLYGITYSLDSFFNWIFFCAAGYSLFMSYFLLPVQPKVFQSRPRETKIPFERQGRSTINVNEPEDKVRKTAGIVIISIVSFFAFLFVLVIVIGIFSDGDQSTTTDTQSSEIESTESSEDDGSSIATLTAEGNRLFNAGEIDSADSYYSQALEIDPDYYEAVYGKGLVYYNRGSKDEASANFARAYEGGYRFAWLSWVLADTYDKAGSTSRAIELYKECLNLDSSYVDSYNRLAELVPDERDKYLGLAERHRSN